MAIKSPLELTGAWWWTHRVGVDELRGAVRGWDDQLSGKELSAAAAANRPSLGADGVSCYSGTETYLQETVTTTQSDDFIAAFIVRIASSPTNGALIGRFTTQGSNNRSWVIDRATDDTVELKLSSDGSATTDYTFALSRFLRHSVVVWKSGTSVRVYVDGTLLVNQTNAPATLRDASGIKFMLGARLDGSGNPLPHDAAFSDVVYGQITATTGQRDDLVQWIEEQRQGVVWSGDILGSDIDDTPVPTKAEFTVHVPTGTLSAGDLASWQYMHHPVISDFGSTFYLEYTPGYIHENQAGQPIVGHKMTSGPTPSFGAFETIFPGQADLDTEQSTAGGRVLFTNPGQMLGNRRFHIASVTDVASGGGTFTDVTLLARERLPDGTLGTIFRLSRESYTPASGYTEHPYDSLLSPQLYERCVIANRYGGSSDPDSGIRHSRWFDDPYTANNLVAPGGSFVLPPRYEGDTPGILRLLRRDGTSDDDYCRSSISYDFGRSWTTPVLTGIPDAPSNTWWDIGPNGELIVVGNPHDGVSTTTGDYRRWLYMAVANPGNRTIDSVYGLAEDANTTASLPGHAKSGGPSYVHFIVIGNYVYATYSVRKEAIKLTRALIPGLDDDNSDLITSLRARTSYILQHMANRR